MQEGTGAGVIFGATGGVMEAALRSAYFLLKGKNPPADAFSKVRSQGFNQNNGVMEADFQIDDITVRTAVVSGLGNTRALLDRILRGEVQYDFVEVMACPYGCIGGAGQPFGYQAVKSERAGGMYRADKSAIIKRPGENPVVSQLYETGVLKGRSHELLHVDYLKQKEAL